MERFNCKKKSIGGKRQDLDKVKQWMTEIDRFIQNRYEDLSRGLFFREQVCYHDSIVGE